MAGLDAGGDDVVSSADGHFVYTALDALSSTASVLEEKFGEAETVKLVWRPKSGVPVSGDAAASLMKMMAALEDCDDVQNVYANFDMTSEEMERLAG